MSAPARAEAFVLAWARRYTAALPEDVAERRLLELASDCWEQRRRGREVGAHPRAVATSMVVRTLAGVLADLTWRRQVLAVHRGRPLHEGGRPMGRWMKDNWWVALGGVMAALVTVAGVVLPFEDRTLGSLIGGSITALLGLAGLAGLVVRRRPGRRTVGDLMIAGGQLPWIPLFWTVVPPILALTVIVAAFIDISDAATTGNDSVGGDGGGHPRRRAVTGALVALLVSAVAAAVVVGDPSFALAVPVPLAILLLLHLTLGQRLAASPLTSAAGVLVAMPLLWWFTIITIGRFEDGYEIEGAYNVVVDVVSIVALVGGAILAIAGVRRGRQARPA